MKKIFPLLLLCFVIISCSEKEEKNLCEVMKYGTFDVYQKDIKVGTFYRKDSLQVETYVGKKITGLTKVKELSECKYMLRSYWAKQKLDTMNFTATYSMNDEDEIVYEMSPTYMDTEIKLRGKIVKVSDSISTEILKKFGKQ
ncbi:MAG: hypothetical protein JXR05_03440 [Flavobacteriaceae bacterium]